MPTKKSSGLKVVQKNFRNWVSVKISMGTSDDQKRWDTISTQISVQIK
jgi:hypothetical protein